MDFGLLLLRLAVGLTLAARPFKLEFQNAMASYFAVFFGSE